MMHVGLRLTTDFHYILRYDGTDCPTGIDHPMQEVDEVDAIVRYTYSVSWQEVCRRMSSLSLHCMGGNRAVSLSDRLIK